MSKVVGFIVGAALIVAGVLTGNVALIVQGGAMIVTQAIVDLTAPKQPARQASEMTIALGEQPRCAQFGETFTPGSLVDGFNYGGKYGTDWEVLIIRLADHKCASLSGFFVNDEYVVYTGDGNYPQFDDHHFELYFRADTTNDPLPSIVTDNGPGWTSADIGESGCDVIVAYLADKPDAKKPAWPGGRPRFGFVVKGKPCYDPRKDDTVTGGAGAHRWDDATTWEWSENPIVCRYNWVRGIYANDVVSDETALLIGRGLSAEEAPPENVIAPANLCDEVPAGVLAYSQPASSMGYSAPFAQSPNGARVIRYVNNDIEWWSAATRLATSYKAGVGSVMLGTTSNFAVADDGTVYFTGEEQVGASAFKRFYEVPVGGTATLHPSNPANAFNGPTRAFDLADGSRKVFTGEPGVGYLDFGLNVATTGSGRDFALSIDRNSVYGVFQPTGSSNQFTITDLTGSNGTHTFTALATRSGPSTAHIAMNAAGNLFVTMDSKFYVIDTVAWSILASGTATWGTAELPIMPGQASFFAGYNQYSLVDGSLIQTVAPLDWVSENSWTSQIYDPLNNAIWTNVQFATHITIRMLGGTRYRIAGPVYANQDFIDVEGMFASAIAGNVVTHEGSVELEPAQAKSVSASFTDNDLVVGTNVAWNEGFVSEANQEWVNTVVSRYVEPQQKWNDHAAPAVRDTSDITADGRPREATITLRLVRDLNQALRVAEINRRLGRLWGRATVTLGPRFCELEEGDWISWTSSRRFGGATKTFRVEAYSINEKWQNTLTLREIAASVYADGLTFSSDQSVATPTTPPIDIGSPTSGQWALAAVTLANGGVSVPALEISGSASDDSSVEAIVIEYWKSDGSTDPTADPDSIPWTMEGEHPPTASKVDITSIQGGQVYYVAVSYIVSGQTGDRQVLGPVTVANVDVSGALAVANQSAIAASEAITAGCFVNIYSSSGAKVRKANATDDTKPVNGYAPSAITSGASGAVQGAGGKISGLSGLTPGATYYLDTTAGAITTTAPSGSGNLVQEIGVAVSATEMLFNPKVGVTF